MAKSGPSISRATGRPSRQGKTPSDWPEFCVGRGLMAPRETPLRHKPPRLRPVPTPGEPLGVPDGESAQAVIHYIGAVHRVIQPTWSEPANLHQAVTKRFGHIDRCAPGVRPARAKPLTHYPSEFCPEMTI